MPINYSTMLEGPAKGKGTVNQLKFTFLCFVIIGGAIHVTIVSFNLFHPHKRGLTKTQLYYKNVCSQDV